jgi:hypothetical protein
LKISNFEKIVQFLKTNQNLKIFILKNIKAYKKCKGKGNKKRKQKKQKKKSHEPSQPICSSPYSSG